MRQKKPYACCDQKSGCCRGNPAEDVPEDRQVSIFKKEQADRETDYPRDDEKARNCCDRSDRARIFAPTQTAMPTMLGPGINWQRLTISANSLSVSQRRFSTATRRAQTTPPPPTPHSETARNAVNKAARGTVCSSCCRLDLPDSGRLTRSRVLMLVAVMQVPTRIGAVDTVRVLHAQRGSIPQDVRFRNSWRAPSPILPGAGASLISSGCGHL